MPNGSPSTEQDGSKKTNTYTYHHATQNMDKEKFLKPPKETVYLQRIDNVSITTIDAGVISMTF